MSDSSIADGFAALLDAHSVGPGHRPDLPALMRDAAEGGWYDVVGLGLSADPDVDVEDALRASEQLGRRLAPVSFVVAAGFVHPLLAALPPGRFTELVAQAEVVAVPTTRLEADDGGGAVFTQSGTVRSTGRPDGTVALHGSVDRLTDATADLLLVTVDEDTLAAVPADAPGVRLQTVPTVIEGFEVARADLDGVVLTTERLRRPGAAEALHRAGATWSLLLDAYAVGTAREMVARSVEFVLARYQFGQAIGSFQAVQHLLADMHISAETSSSMVLAAARSWISAPETALPEIVASRLHAGAAAVSACESAIQLHGGIGFTWELGLHRWYRAAQFARGYLSEEAGMRDFLAGCLDRPVGDRDVQGMVS